MATPTPDTTPRDTAYADLLAVARGIYADTIQYGGGTYHARNGAPILRPSGYFVGGAQVETVVDAIDREAATVAIARHMKRIPLTVTGEPAYFLGTWVDGDLLIIDSVTYTDDEVAAMVDSIERGQRSYWDISERHDVNVYGTHQRIA